VTRADATRILEVHETERHLHPTDTSSIITPERFKVALSSAANAR
jgi:hypothetical protein